jgi:hypothetical protein
MVMKISAIHEVEDEANSVRSNKCISHTNDEGAVLSLKT